MDDIVDCTDLQELVERVRLASQKLGLVINTAKTKVMVLLAKNKKNVTIGSFSNEVIGNNMEE